MKRYQPYATFGSYRYGPDLSYVDHLWRVQLGSLDDMLLHAANRIRRLLGKKRTPSVGRAILLISQAHATKKASLKWRELEPIFRAGQEAVWYAIEVHFESTYRGSDERRREAFANIRELAKYFQSC